ncbi:hypothetical protein DPMN_013290 [Dreissena polymorpha]|uniref:Uncharacterized protein n=1 Tax=Dreissena polymorpha TaxID=45954 RepID=A0A9D4N8P4_DREPO|nr:hypothetical protein DPMN_013290 [Dreissena polymorpha]
MSFGRALVVHVSILKIVPEPTMSNRAPLSLMNRLKKTESAIFDLIFGLVALEGSKISESSYSLTVELSVSQSFSSLQNLTIYLKKRWALDPWTPTATLGLCNPAFYQLS